MRPFEGRGGDICTASLAVLLAVTGGTEPNWLNVTPSAQCDKQGYSPCLYHRVGVKWRTITSTLQPFTVTKPGKALKKIAFKTGSHNIAYAGLKL